LIIHGAIGEGDHGAVEDQGRSARRMQGDQRTRGDFKMTITKKLELAARLKREMDSAIETLMKRDGLTRAAATEEGKRFYAESRQERLRKATRIT
jgi:hypothetical protein